MKTSDLVRDLLRNDHRGRRQHRYMESADINAAFREFFTPLRAYVRRGMQTEGQVYAVEMDTCIPGVLLATDWLPLAVRGIEDPATIGAPVLYREIVSADATSAAEDPIRPGQGGHRRDLIEAPHRRLDPLALA